MSMESVAVYAGSFNPLHKGHLTILRRLAVRYDRVLLVVSPQNPFKDAAQAASGASRLEAARRAVARYPELGNVRVDDIELGMDPPHYTIRTLDALAEREKGARLTLVVGADNLGSFPRWRDYARILTEYGIAVFPRKGWHRGRLRARLLRENPAYRIELLDMPRKDISSSRIREGLAAGEDMSRWLM